MVSLDGVIRQIEDDLEVLVQQKGAEIHHHNLPTVHGVSFLIYQLFYNLINNSLKFSQAAIAPKIVIRGQALKGDEPLPPGAKAGTSYVAMTLSDNGIGFDQGYAEKIFNTFARLNAKDKYEGTGLGLALCKNIAERHHGYITAKGIEGVGATFTIVLPGSLENS
jgi:light-regulated signal transduction histidine kinase (bacteriophytochrome)